MDENQNYKDALKEVESIIANLEKGDLDIDDVLKNVKRASQLIQFCKERLRVIDEEVNKLLNE
ncbi:MAG: exodeoxyribonuclease VII small subunit [Prevotellaceae bacterium]|jgi:exodeoxyribonuclease VII small subunit|nr:exodeoxyribonuclease VII small subunit [Prevotellaceae bacterium]